jgi:hypothetical protein
MGSEPGGGDRRGGDPVEQRFSYFGFLLGSAVVLAQEFFVCGDFYSSSRSAADDPGPATSVAPRQTE